MPVSAACTRWRRARGRGAGWFGRMAGMACPGHGVCG
jgi:hypothetical protein